MLHDMSEVEARALLGAPLVCNEPDDWSVDPSHHFTERIECGLVTVLGERPGLYLSFKFTGNRKKLPDRYMFSVFKLDRGRTMRVYQLDLTRWPYLPGDVHAWPHEHIGKTKVTGDASWLTWTFDDMINRFCETTNIEFRPEPPSDPTLFSLRRS
jgi:hypothetical protein